MSFLNRNLRRLQGDKGFNTEGDIEAPPNVLEELVVNIRNPLIASFATKEQPYRGVGTGIRRALTLIPGLRLEADHDRNMFPATIPGHEIS
jgi:hypothetical protein